jgi:hypothetical protein
MLFIFDDSRGAERSRDCQKRTVREAISRAGSAEETMLSRRRRQQTPWQKK